MKNPAWAIKKQPAERGKRTVHFRCFCMHVEIVTQPGVIQTLKTCLELTFFRGDQEVKIVFTCKIERLIESFIALV